MVKIMGGVLILISATGIGISCGRDLKMHYTRLLLWKQLLYLLKGEISYHKSPLPEAFERLSVRLPDPFPVFLKEMAGKMSCLDGRSFASLWKEELKDSPLTEHLKREEKEDLEDLGAVLGYLDIQMQLASIELYLERLNLAIQKAQEELFQKQRLYRSLGIAGGVFLVILLF